MTTILLGNQTASAIDHASLEEMFRFRHKVFAERLGWEVKSVQGMEIDYFDTLSPHYMLARAGNQQIAGCWRLLPTTGPYMLRDTFPQLLCGEAPPCAESIWELSRFAAESPERGDLAQACLSPTTFAMIRAIYDHAVQHQITQYVTVTSVALERLLLKLDLPVTRFGDGKAHRVGKVLSVACRIEINAQFRRVVYPDPVWR